MAHRPPRDCGLCLRSNYNLAKLTLQSRQEARENRGLRDDRRRFVCVARYCGRLAEIALLQRAN